MVQWSKEVTLAGHVKSFASCAIFCREAREEQERLAAHDRSLRLRDPLKNIESIKAKEKR
jgi:hypothetical protein